MRLIRLPEYADLLTPWFHRFLRLKSGNPHRRYTESRCARKWINAGVTDERVAIHTVRLRWLASVWIEHTRAPTVGEDRYTHLRGIADLGDTVQTVNR